MNLNYNFRDFFMKLDESTYAFFPN